MFLNRPDLRPKIVQQVLEVIKLIILKDFPHSHLFAQLKAQFRLEVLQSLAAPNLLTLLSLSRSVMKQLILKNYSNPHLKEQIN